MADGEAGKGGGGVVGRLKGGTARGACSLLLSLSLSHPVSEHAVWKTEDAMARQGLDEKMGKKSEQHLAEKKTKKVHPPSCYEPPKNHSLTLPNFN